MTLRELLSHFTNKTIWVDLQTPLFRVCGEIKHIENQLPSHILDIKISDWTFTNSLNINM